MAKTLFLNKVTDRIMFCFLPHTEDGKGLDVSDYLEANAMTDEQFRDVVVENLCSFEDSQDNLSKYDGETVLSFNELMNAYKDFPTEEMPKVIQDYIKIKSSMDNTNIEYHCLGVLAAFGSSLTSVKPRFSMSTRPLSVVASTAYPPSTAVNSTST